VRDLLRDLFHNLSLLPRLPGGDILVTNSFWLPMMAAPMSRRVGKVVVSANRFPKGQYRWYGQSHLIAAASTAVRNAIIHEAPSLHDRTVVIPNPVDARFLGANPDQRPLTERPTLLYVGRIHPEKGLDLLVRVFATHHKSLPFRELRLVGPWKSEQGGGGEGYLENLKRMVGDSPIQFVGPIYDTGALLAEFLKGDVFVYPSVAETGEAFGLAPLEAMATGMPAIVSALDCFRDFVHPYKNGWSFDHSRTNAGDWLLNVLTEASTNHDLRGKLGIEARRTAQAYSYHRVAEKFMDAFQQINKVGKASDSEPLGNSIRR
jgi:glycosyltransferase involved in cell wall biosynthesis